MKKQIAYLTMFLFAIGFVFAANADAQGQANLQTIENIKNSDSAMMNATVEVQIQEKIALSEGQFKLQNGKTVEINKVGNKTQLKIGNQSVNCSESCNLSQIKTQEQTKLQATLSNGKNAEVKIMPETASQTAINRLRLKSCEEGNCSIELKEVGQGNGTKLAYEIKTKNEAKFLGLFKSQATLETQIDAETGEVIAINKPWWVRIKSE